MPDQKTIERVQQERHTANHAQIYEKKKQCEELDKELEEKKKLGYEVGRLQMKHDNDLWNQQNEMIRQELKDCINDKEYKCIKFMSDDKEYMSALNSAKIYEQKKKCEELDKELEEKKKLGYEVGRLQMKQDNDLLNQQTEMIKQELITMINEKGDK